MALYGLTMAIVLIINYPQSWRPLFGWVMSRFSRKVPISPSDTRRLPSIGESVESSDRTLETFVESTEASAVLDVSTEKNRIRPTKQSTSAASSVESRKNVRFGSLSCIAEASPDPIDCETQEKCSDEDSLKYSLHSTITQSSRVSFAEAIEVIKPAVTRITDPTVAFTLDAIKAPSKPKRQQASNSVKSINTSQSSEEQSLRLPSIPWFDDHQGTGSSVSTPREESTASSENINDAAKRCSIDNSTQSKLSHRLRTRLSQGRKVVNETTRDRATSSIGIDTDSVPSTLSSVMGSKPSPHFMI
jgi:hypothetical protein